MIFELNLDQIGGCALALGGFVWVLLKWMADTSLEKMRCFLEKEKLPDLSKYSCWGDIAKDSTCRKWCNSYFLYYRIVLFSYYLLPIILMLFMVYDIWYLYSHCISNGSKVFEKVSLPIGGILIFLFEILLIIILWAIVECFKRKTYEPVV